jgi:thymidylate synthase
MYTSYYDLLNDVYKYGEIISPSNITLNRSFATKELTNVQLKIDNFSSLLIDKNEVTYLTEEMKWYCDHVDISNKQNINKKLKDMAFELLDGVVNRAGPNSNYGEMCLRLKNHIGITQLDWIIEKLTKDSSSRQAIAFYNSPNYQYYSNQDFVCTLTQMFNIKDDKLNTTVNIRSNDLMMCFRFDSIWYRSFQQIVCNRLQKIYPQLQLGYLFCNIFSAHYYLKDEEKVKNYLNNNLTHYDFIYKGLETL